MPSDTNISEPWQGFGLRPAGGIPPTPRRPHRKDIERALAGGGLTVREIAEKLDTTTRQVHQVVCNLIRDRSRWLSRMMPVGGREYRYFLTTFEGTT